MKELGGSQRPMWVLAEGRISKDHQVTLSVVIVQIFMKGLINYVK